ncbi:MAG: 4-hydroxythreonine-4-phosphate dehydrogenase PdxA [Ignavibacteriales bacterium]|nr:4-hydroxythreonine-4-phosphate dehydrogenase PdxA [Ignavibacteriales bacterium]
MKPLIAVTLGDFNGVGPEIALKAATHASTRKLCTPLLVGPLNIFESVRDKLKIKAKLQRVVFPWKEGIALPVLDVGDGLWADIRYGEVTKAAGKSAGVAIEKSVELCTSRKVAAMVTAPVSKEAMQLAGYNFPGQTEMIALLSRSNKVAMMLVSEKMRIGLVTIHAPLRSVAESISKEKIVDKTTIIFEALKSNFQISKPRIAILSLNPHAGEHGLLGSEEDDILKPAIEELTASGLQVVGPVSADAFFGTAAYKAFDAILAMYHDQGLIPVKMSSFKTTVNFSAGLSIIRTSPGHGTAFDIAGKGTADISSMLEAIKYAVRFSKTR